MVAALHEFDIVREAFPPHPTAGARGDFLGHTKTALSPRKSNKPKRWRRPTTPGRASASATPRSPPMLFDLLAAPFVDYQFMRRALVGAVALALAGQSARRVSGAAADVAGRRRAVARDPAGRRDRLSRRGPVAAGDDAGRFGGGAGRGAGVGGGGAVFGAARGRLARRVLPRLPGAWRHHRVAPGFQCRPAACAVRLGAGARRRGAAAARRRLDASP